jgi:hypothetical protein
VGTDAPAPLPGISREELREVYGVAIDELRFEVTLNWQRTQYYFSVNTAILAVAASILKIGGTSGWMHLSIVGILFGLGAATARLGRRMIVHGHTYFRRAAYKKTLIEQLLGRFEPIGASRHPAANLAITTTAGMLAAGEILRDPQKYIEQPPRKGTVTHALLTMMWLFMIVDAAAALSCFALAVAAAVR